MTATFIALLRAVNVGGANSLPTKDLVRILESMGLRNVKTCIQSGNAVFQTEETDAAGLAENIQAGIRRDRGFAPQVILLHLDELQSAVAANPYPEARSLPRALHLTFLASTPRKAGLAALAKLCKETEQYTLKGQVFYFWAPDGVGRSKAFSRVEKALGVATTARNWRTACKILELAQEVAVAARGQAGQSNHERNRKLR